MDEYAFWNVVTPTPLPLTNVPGLCSYPLAHGKSSHLPHIQLWYFPANKDYSRSVPYS